MDAEEVQDPVPVIGRHHFEEAFASARRSVTIHDLHKFEEFRKKFDPVYAKKVGGAEAGPPKIDWPDEDKGQFDGNNDDDEDLYS